MLRPRWKKVFRDLLADRMRTLLVVLSITVGVFAFGTIMTTRIVFAENMTNTFLAINPASATITTEPFDETLIDVVRNVPGVADAQGLRVVGARIQTGPQTWQDASLYVLPDEGVRSIAEVAPWAGAWPPPDRAILLERSSLVKTGAAMGDPIRVALTGGRTRDLPIAGLTHDLSLPTSVAVNQAAGYITFDTLAWLGGPRDYNQIQFVVAERRDDEAHIEQIAAAVEQAIERSGRTVIATDIPTPLEHPAASVLPTVLGLLTGMSVLALFISTFLIINTISAILTQQTRQIGVMKAIGARNGQLAVLYFMLSAAFGVIAFLIAVPLSYLAASGLTGMLGGQLNVDIVQMRLPLEVVLMQALTAVGVPMVASVAPVRQVVRRPAREALSGVTEAPGGNSPLDRVLRRLPGLSRPTQLALRNTFRRKGRLIRTLAALAFGGAVFMAVLTLQSSLFQTMDDSFGSQLYDVEIQFNRQYRADRVMAAVATVPEVTSVESLRRANALPVRADGSTGEALNLRAVPADTALFAPNVAAGRWLLPDDARAVVLTTNFRLKEPGTQVGDEVTLKIGDHESRWMVVGFIEELAPQIAPAWAYVPLDAYTRVAGGSGRTDTLRVTTAQSDPAGHAAASAALEAHLEAYGYDVQLIRSRSEDRALFEEQFAVLIVVLTSMALLIGTVGGLGLSGTMSINVLERTREIGVMRAIGATDGAIRRIVLSEGITVALLAWLIGTLFSVPLSYVMGFALGTALLNSPLAWVYSFTGVGVWLVIMLVIATLASLLPARSAVRLTVREVLAYE